MKEYPLRPQKPRKPKKVQITKCECGHDIKNHFGVIPLMFADLYLGLHCHFCMCPKFEENKEQKTQESQL